MALQLAHAPFGVLAAVAPLLDLALGGLCVCGGDAGGQGAIGWGSAEWAGRIREKLWDEEITWS